MRTIQTCDQRDTLAVRSIRIKKKKGFENAGQLRKKSKRASLHLSL